MLRVILRAQLIRDGGMNEFRRVGDDFRFAQIGRIREDVEEPEPRLHERFVVHSGQNDFVFSFVEPFVLGKIGSVEDRQDFGREPGNGLVPLVHDAGVMAPITAQFLQRFPQRGRGKRFAAGQQPNVEENGNDSFAELVADILLHGRRGKKGVVGRQEKAENRFPSTTLNKSLQFVK